MVGASEGVADRAASFSEAMTGDKWGERIATRWCPKFLYSIRRRCNRLSRHSVFLTNEILTRHTHFCLNLILVIKSSAITVLSAAQGPPKYG